MFGRLCFKIVFILFLFAFFSPVNVSHAIDLLINNDTGTQGKKNYQVEINTEFAHDSENGTKADTVQLSTILSYGLTDSTDVIIDVPYQFIRLKENGERDRESGLSDIALELKWRFYENQGLSFALKPGVSLPTGDHDQGLGAGKIAYRASLITTKEIDPWTFHITLGYTRNENKVDERKNLWNGSLTAVYSIAEKFRLVGNVGLESNTDRNVNTSPAYILGGLIYSPLNNLDTYFGLKGGLNKPEADYSVLAGLAWRF
jgi:hypothetical protein